MTYEDLRMLKRADPFVPFRIHLTLGEQYDVLFPDMILGTASRVHIAYDEPNRPAELAGRTRIVGWQYVDRVEMLDRAAVAGR